MTFSVPEGSALQWIWLAWILYWFGSALTAKRSVKRESGATRLRTLLVVIPAAVLLSYTGIQFGILQHRFVPDLAVIRAVGFFFTFLGLGITLWARHHLGKFWSARVALKQDHELIRSGPYAHVRHPIYSGLFIALLGTALVVGEWRALLAVLLVFLAHMEKAHREEKLLAEQFGEVFARYRAETGWLFPRW